MKWTNHQDLMKLREASKKKNWKPKKKIKKHKVKKQFKPVYKNYAEYLASKEWKAKRLKVLDRANYICEICGIKRAYQVHHKTYKRIYRERLTDLVATCGICHQAEHNLLTEEQIEKAVDNLMVKGGMCLK